MRGDVLSICGGALAVAFGSALVWLVRRIHVAVPVAVTLTVAPLAQVAHDRAPAPVTKSETSRAAPPVTATAQGLYPRDAQNVVVTTPPRVTSAPKAPAPVKTRARVAAPTKPALRAPTPEHLARLYMKVGNALKTAADVDPIATRDLWPRYRWIHFNEAIKSADKRAAAAAVLDQLLADVNALSP